MLKVNILLAWPELDTTSPALIPPLRGRVGAVKGSLSEVVRPGVEVHVDGVANGGRDRAGHVRETVLTSVDIDDIGQGKAGERPQGEKGEAVHLGLWEERIVSDRELDGRADEADQRLEVTFEMVEGGNRPSQDAWEEYIDIYPIPSSAASVSSVGKPPPLICE